MAKTAIEPTPVLIDKEQKPVPVVIAEGSKYPKTSTVSKGEGLTMAPNTTEEGDRVTAGQRHISRVWEYTQAAIAFIVTVSTVFTLSMLALSKYEPTPNALIMAGQLVVMDTLILTFYYARTNHTAIGGVGPKADDYKGR